MMEEFTPIDPQREQPVPAPEEPAPEGPVSEEQPPEEPAPEGPVLEEQPPEEPAPEAPVSEEQPPVEPIPDEPQPTGPSLEDVLEAQERLLRKAEDLEGLFRARIAHTDHEEKIVDQMHRELQKHREGLYAQLVRPILLDVIQVRDSIRRMAAAYREKPEGQRDIPNKTFGDYALDLQDILERNEVEVFETAPGQAFAPLRQRVIKKVPTGQEELHGKVAASLSDGYSYNGRTLSPEKVAVYVYEKPAAETAETEKSEEMNHG